MYSITKERAGVDVVAVKNDLNVKVQEGVKNFPTFEIENKLGVLNRFKKPDYISKL